MYVYLYLQYQYGLKLLGDSGISKFEDRKTEPAKGTGRQQYYHERMRTAQSRKGFLGWTFYNK